MTEHLNTKENQISMREELESILDRSVTPENITSYADDALEDLIDFSSKVVKTYSPESHGAISRQLEERAFESLGLTDLGATLDHVAQLSADIDSVNDVVANAKRLNQTITPTEAVALEVKPGGREFAPRKHIDRLKTVLFVLSKDLEVDIENPSELTILTGVVDKSMMREASYYSLEVPQFNRQILVCDELGNATYVFDTEALKHEEETKDLLSLKKSELNAIIARNSDAGARLSYSPNFLSDIREKMTGSLGSEMVASPPVGKNYLRVGEAPKEGYLSLRAIAIHRGVSQGTIQRAAHELQHVLGDTIMAQFRSRNAVAYSVEQQEMIMNYLHEKGFFAEQVADGYESIEGISRQLGISHNGIARVIRDLGDELGEVASQKFHTVVAKSYSPEQQRIIRERLEHEGMMTIAPEDYKSVPSLSEMYGLSEIPLTRLIKSLGESLGDVMRAKVHTIVTDVYSPDQQLQILEAISASGLTAPQAPEGYISRSRFATDLRVSSKTLEAITDRLEQELGEVVPMKFISRISPAYSPDQQEIIRHYVDATTVAPIEEMDGYRGVSALAEELGVSFQAVQHAIASLSGELGHVEKARYGRSKVADAYSSDQQQQIYEKLSSSKRIKNLGSLVLRSS